MKKSIGGCLGVVLGFVVIGGCSAVVAGISSDSGSDSSGSPSVSDSRTVTGEKPKKVTSFPDGDYQVGVDIPTGTYESEGAKEGLFEFCMITTEGDGNNNWGQIKSANANERIIITLKTSDKVVSVSGCEPLVRR
jgi:hypothetical protein